jgi:hypothetical protein
LAGSQSTVMVVLAAGSAAVAEGATLGAVEEAGAGAELAAEGGAALVAGAVALVAGALALLVDAAVLPLPELQPASASRLAAASKAVALW